MNKDKALKLALDVLMNSRSLEPVDIDWVKGKRHAVITAIREALAQPEQEQKLVERDVHTEHCYQDEYEHGCKYGEGDFCTAKPEQENT